MVNPPYWSAISLAKEFIGNEKNEKQEPNEVGKIYSKPWGHYKTLLVDKNYQVKLISIGPGGKLSLQKHHHRCEHWVIVKGHLKVIKGEEASMRKENDYIYIEKGELHRLENEGSTNAEVIEIQYGDYLGEDDIVRIDDQYGRITKK